MKAFRIIAVLALTLLFCSCNKEELIIGMWQVDKSASYSIKGDRRTYFDEDHKYDGKIFLIAFYKDGQCKTSDGDVARYHIDGDYVYAGGDPARILKLNNKRLILENDDFHAEFDNITTKKNGANDDKDNHKNPLLKLLNTIQCAPLWERIVICLIPLVISFDLIRLGKKVKDDNSWLDMKSILYSIAATLWILVLVILFG